MTNVSPSRPRTRLLLVTALFAAPVLAAYLLFFAFPQWWPRSHTNTGVLVTPARPAPRLNWLAADGQPLSEPVLHGRWTLLYLGAAECGDACRERLYVTRQVRLALGQDRDRVQRLYIAPDAATAKNAEAMLTGSHPDLRIVVEAGVPGERLADFLEHGPTGNDPQAVYLFDPRGNWMMVYPGGAQPKGMHRDLKTLLRLSRIG